MAVDALPLLTFVLVTTFTPGPNNISSAAMGVAYGYRRTLSFLVGIAVGFFIVMLVSAYLSTALLTALPLAERYLRWAGGIYILWLAVGTLRADYGFDGKGGGAKRFTKGFALQLINPKVAVYGLTLYSTFLAAISDRLGMLALFAALFAATAFAATSTWALCGAAIRQRLRQAAFRRAVNVLLALLLVYTAISLSGIMSRL